MKRKDNITIPASKLKHHPNNPRKDLGDLSELKKSIEKNGLLQNLSVIPVDKDDHDCDDEKADHYLVLIGNRRYEAGKGILQEFPCNILEGLSEREQLSIMLEENMQRNDLTIIEQAEGFQMMLDLGETVEGIVEKTGFSETTVYHRLNIAKLDKKILKKAFDDKEFQLSITDLYELERIKEQSQRNKILREARSSREIKQLVNKYMTKQKSIEHSKKIITLLEEYGITKMPQNLEMKRYNSYEELRCYQIPECKIPNKITGITKPTKEKPVYYYLSTDYMGTVYRIEIYIPRDKSKQPKSEYEIRYEKIKAAEKKVKDKQKEIDHVLRIQCANIITGKLEKKDGFDEGGITTAYVLEELWQELLRSCFYLDNNELIYSWTTKSRFEMDEDKKKEFTDVWEKGKPSVIDQMVIALITTCFTNSVVGWDHKPNNNCEKYRKVFHFLEVIYGYYMADQYCQFMDGKGLLWSDLEKISK